jgi:hypothetical protein
MRTHRLSRVQSSTVESNQTRKDTAETIWPTHYGRARASTHRHRPVKSSPVQSNRTRKTRHLPYQQWLRASMSAHRQRQVEFQESCRVDSIGATCFIFVSRLTGIGCDGCYIAFGNGRRKVVLLVQVHQAICDAYHCDQRKRPTVTDGRIAQCSF